MDNLVADVFSQKQGAHGGCDKQNQTGFRGDPVDSSQNNRVVIGILMARHTYHEIQACSASQNSNDQGHEADDEEQTHMVIGFGRFRVGILDRIRRIYSHNHVVIAVVVRVGLLQLGRYGLQRRVQIGIDIQGFAGYVNIAAQRLKLLRIINHGVVIQLGSFRISLKRYPEFQVAGILNKLIVKRIVIPYMGQHFFCQFGHGGIRFSRLGILMVGIVGTPVHPDVLFTFFRCVAAIHLKLFIQIIAHGLGHTHHLVNGIFFYFPGAGGHTDDRLVISQLSV